ncbi:MAG: undecaprenyl-phosphate galactose phosphotransferase [Microgenomates group bacterium GW2011_GWC1_37_8]|uniref:Undecaprenyl-phosphate galactose phosphotransferase n=1 Tax=Candidatus Woesebacteria bacterium GW2011_GWB1_38_8 TaxID=1618570 RepID=A0A0G0LCU2_9BACT|nr:MAG: undecaprenyl-phosphate galactose phosphotransferase [Microgenomates group bacterium GW2011_GWC1_37_8]KKQ85700.1 MAG: Undecaprenyl-phosphate galactose phosphotransferase [Candidatus Woesebacteria bacterium GW2011_GWB1_38_8]
MYYEIVKRTIDILGSTFLIIIFCPLMFISAILIKLTSPGPMFADIPQRVGKNGKMFRLYKFRSMIVNAHEQIRTDPKFSKLYKEYKSSSYKLFKDPRITKIGKVIRKYSIDEMPQFINVLKGEMSIVGPRAYFADELEEQQRKYPHTKKLVRETLSVKPGISGYWQVSGRSEVNFDKRIEMDAYYARKRSILFDVLILLKTPWAMISGKGAV